MSEEQKKPRDTVKNPNGFSFKKIGGAIAGKFTELRAEFRKIVWPSRETLIKHTVTTIVISLIFGAFITVLDGLFGVIFTSLVGLMS